MSEQDQEKQVPSTETPASPEQPESPEPAEAETERSTGAPEDASPDAPAERTAPPSPNRGKALLWLLTAGLLLVAGSSGYLWWNDLRRDRAMAEMASRLSALETASARHEGRIEELRQTLETLRGDTLSRLEGVERRLSALSAAHTSLEQAVVALGRRDRAASGDWSLAEVEYLLLVANQRLQLARDVETAIRALLEADRRLRDLADPRLLQVRNAIAQALTRLRAVPRVDVGGLALELRNLALEAAALAPRSTRPRTLGEAPAGRDTGAASAPAGEGGAAPEKSLAGLWEQLRSLVVIRHHDQPIAPMLAPEEASLVRQILRLRLEAARTDLLAADAERWRADLAAAADWLGEYFDTSRPAAQGLLQALARLREVEIRPPLPDISQPLHLLREVMEAPPGTPE